MEFEVVPAERKSASTVTGELEGAGVALEEGAEAALAAGEVELTGVGLGLPIVGRGVEGGVDVGVDGAGAVDVFEREEGDRGDGDALVVDGGGGLDLLGQVALGCR